MSTAGLESWQGHLTSSSGCWILLVFQVLFEPWSYMDNHDD